MKNYRLLLLTIAILIELAAIVILAAGFHPTIGISVLVLGIALLVMATAMGRSDQKAGSEEE